MKILDTDILLDHLQGNRAALDYLSGQMKAGETTAPAGEPGDRSELQLAPEPTFDTPLFTVQTAEPEAALPRPGPGRYFVRVRSVDADGIAGPYGGVQQVDVPHSRWWWLLPAGLLLLVL